MRDEIKEKPFSLRRPVIGDASVLADWINNYEVAKQTATFTFPYTYLHAEYWILLCPMFWKRSLAYNYVIDIQGEAVGSIGLFRSSVNGEFEIGYMLSRKLWGQGIMTMAVKTLLREGKAQLNLERCHAGVFADNPASAQLLRKIGFSQIGEDSIFSMARGCVAAGHRFVFELETLE